MLFITIDGKPATNQHVMQRGYMRKADKARSWQAMVGHLAVMEMRKKPDNTPTLNPVRVSIKIYRKIPKSFNKQQVHEALVGKLRPTTRPDCDNTGKLCCDALNKVVYVDDSQVVELLISKVYTNGNDKVEVLVEEIV